MAKKKFRVVFDSGPGGWTLGEIVEIEAPTKEVDFTVGFVRLQPLGFWARNDSGLYENRDDGTVLLIPID